MENKQFSNLGEQLESFVQDAVNRLDFDKLNDHITNTVGDVIEEVQDNIRRSYTRREDRYRYEWREKEQQNQSGPTNYGAYNKHHRRKKTAEYAEQNKEQLKHGGQGRSVSGQKMAVARENEGILIRNTSGDSTISALKMVAGLFLALGTLIWWLVQTAVFLDGGRSSGAWGAFSGFCILLFGGFSLTAISGGRKRQLLKRFRQYVRIIKGRSYITIKELARRTVHTERYVLRDLKKMIRERMFLEGCIDEEKTCLMLNHEVYEQYCLAKKGYAERLEAEQQEAEQVGNVLDLEIRQVMEEGRSYITQIKAANERIPGVEISNKMYRLELVTGKIFDHVEEHPEQVSEIRRLMDYYLPTTLKLVTTYEKLHAQSIESSNIASARKEIEKTLDTINEAFEKLFDSLYADVALDVSVDARTLKTILAQEGLTGNGLDDDREA